uniref:Secreted protein n=1 Tax=Ixodes ricinus TaxID=34613 RepID=A0A6B0UVN5_IXORI
MAPRAGSRTCGLSLSLMLWLMLASTSHRSAKRLRQRWPCQLTMTGTLGRRVAVNRGPSIASRAFLFILYSGSLWAFRESSLDSRRSLSPSDCMATCRARQSSSLAPWRSSRSTICESLLAQASTRALDTEPCPASLIARLALAPALSSAAASA